MARPRKTIEAKREAKARYAREHARTEYPEGLIQELLDAPVLYGAAAQGLAAVARTAGSIGPGCRWRQASRGSGAR